MSEPKRRPSSTRSLIDWLARQPAFADDRGGANGKLHAAAVYAGVYAGGTSGLSSLLKSLEAEGIVKRDVRGKRTYLIAYTGPPVEPDPEPVEAPADIPSESDLQHVDPLDPDTWTPEPTATVTPDADVPKLVGRVRLELDLDPAMARMVLDYVERGDGVRPIDRAQARILIAESVNKATERTSAGTSRLMDRIADLEADVANLSTALRAVTSNSNGARPARPPRPNFKRLGVKDSELRKLMTELTDDGWTLTKNGGGHVRAAKPDHDAFILPSTPSDYRSVMNARSEARGRGASV